MDCQRYRHAPASWLDGYRDHHHDAVASVHNGQIRVVDSPASAPKSQTLDQPQPEPIGSAPLFGEVIQ
jgi:hypothetical protein